MPIPDPKREALQDQVNAKIKWNADEDEVLAWLSQRHFIRGTDATEMIETAKRHRARIVRERSLYGMIISAVAALVSGAMSLGNWFGGVLFLRGSFVMLAACAISVVWFLRYLTRFLSGRSVIAE
jgi:hypothetical protein